ncbi:MAG TPA: FAD-dependent oxidoreductase [Actinospica sp.]|jgi:3-phenylpropionate/trans-cinnamate dioxygenase ferredoxin reductase subunit|nr:FAD-dependent oxidoreductase [Actinospica sp.]
MSGRNRAGTLILGAGQAGLQLAVTLRQLGDAGAAGQETERAQGREREPITLVGEEPHPPYQRPPLSKEFLTGAAGEEALELRRPAFYAESGITLLRGERVETIRLDPAEAANAPGAVGAAVTGTGRRIPFARLALTVGAAPRRLRVPGAQLTGVCYLRDRDDAVDLKIRLAAAERVVVIGGGFVGLEAAAAARALGKTVTVVEAAPRLIGRAVAPSVSEFYRSAHERRGTRVLLSAGVTAIEGRGGRVAAVHLADGTRLAADLVLVGIGVVPRTELAEHLGLACDGGILVDGYARTSNPHVVAAGDCTVQPHPLTGEGLVRIESVQNAVAQAGTAAATLLGRAPQAPAVPWFWSHQGDLKLQIAGLSAGHDGTVLRGDPATERFSVLYYRHGRLLAIDAVNSPADYMVVRKVLTEGGTIPPELAAEAATPLKELAALALADGQRLGLGSWRHERSRTRVA